ncbi:hypothetical protein LTS18_002814 [Coniosporium uncinatum]|uniref:Uncharacterized protein n=1 Tax=Coniosporium uncinatum TaxID=93489 RepID=A0ACC3DUG8_9PEZI|nr:hypothetical protein LTS18_002814 [Coniosporium uncinatum]
MSSAIVKLFVALLAAGTASALPQPQTSYSSAADTSSTSSSLSSSTPTASSAPADPNVNNMLIADLKDAPTAIDRFKSLFVGADGKVLPPSQLAPKIIFDFAQKATAAPGARGGKTAAANIKTFPVLTDLGVSTTLGFLSACGINTPHTHPRATEFLTVAQGALDFGMVFENGLVEAGKRSAEVRGHLERFQGTVFPVGSVHYQVNPTCDDAVFVATLNSEDPGTSQIAQNFFGLRPDVVNATLGFPESLDGRNLEGFRSRIPANLAVGVEECLRRCGIEKNM